MPAAFVIKKKKNMDKERLDIDFVNFNKKDFAVYFRDCSRKDRVQFEKGKEGGFVYSLRNFTFSRNKCYTLMFSSPAGYFRWPMVFTMDLAARENIVIPIGVLLEIFVTPTLGARYVQIMATNESRYQVQCCNCFANTFPSLPWHRKKQNNNTERTIDFRLMRINLCMK